MDKKESLLPVDPQKALLKIGKQIDTTNKLLKRIEDKEVTKKQIICPRCKGKGFVDWDDIKRLGNVGRWTPGNCAYCNMLGIVPESKLSQIDPSEPSLFWRKKL